jgi:predicted nuclease of predicted toxin-antitoxin system
VNVLADEGVDRTIVEQLRADGHDVLYIAEASPSITDDEVLDLANSRGALLITADKDFGELVFRLRQAHSGVMLLRFAGLSPGIKATTVSAVLRNHGAQLTGAFTVVDTGGSIRIRQTP